MEKYLLRIDMDECKGDHDAAMALETNTHDLLKIDAELVKIYESKSDPITDLFVINCGITSSEIQPLYYRGKTICPECVVKRDMFNDAVFLRDNQKGSEEQIQQFISNLIREMADRCYIRDKYLCWPVPEGQELTREKLKAVLLPDAAYKS